MMPPRDQTGVPPHFTSSTTSGSAARISSRTFASVRPRQSSRPAIFASMAFDASGPLIGLPLMSRAIVRSSHLLAGQRRGLFHPIRELRLVQRPFVDVEVAHVLLLRGP